MRYQCHKILDRMGREKMFSMTECFNTPAIRSRSKNLARKIRLGLFIRVRGFSHSFIIRRYDCGLDLAKRAETCYWRHSIKLSGK